MNHQQELDDLIRGMTPSPLLEERLPWYAENIRMLDRRMHRLMRVKHSLMKKEKLTMKERRFLNRYRGKIVRIAAVIQHREYLSYVAKLRIQRGAKPAARNELSR